MPSPYPARSPASMPGARNVRLARRLAGGMTPAEVARHEGTRRGRASVTPRGREVPGARRLLPARGGAARGRARRASDQDGARQPPAPRRHGRHQSSFVPYLRGQSRPAPGKPAAPPRDAHDRSPSRAACRGRDRRGAGRAPSPPSLFRTLSPSPGTTRTWPTGSSATPRAARPRWERAGPGRWRSKRGE